MAREYLAGFTGTEAVLFIGRAQEKVPLFRTRKRRRADGSSYPWIAAETGVVNQYYCYCVDEDFGPFFLKFCSYFPFNAKLCINGNEWAKRQAARAGIGFTPMDNAFAAVDNVAAVQAICHGLGPAQIDALLRKWLARLPHPFSPADRAAGYRYDISILQAEFSLTQMLDKPVSGRIFFEQVIRDNLDLGRPDRISLIFGRSPRPAAGGASSGAYPCLAICPPECPRAGSRFSEGELHRPPGAGVNPHVPPFLTWLPQICFLVLSGSRSCPPRPGYETRRVARSWKRDLIAPKEHVVIAPDKDIYP